MNFKISKLTLLPPVRCSSAEPDRYVFKNTTDGNWYILEVWNYSTMSHSQIIDKQPFCSKKKAMQWLAETWRNGPDKLDEPYKSL